MHCADASLTIVQLGIMAVAAVPILEETYGPVLQARKQAKLDMETGFVRKEVTQVFKFAWNRPFKMLFFSPIVPLVGFYTAITNSYATICFATLGTVFQDNYGFSPGASGLAYLGFTVGFIFCQITLGIFSDRHIVRIEKLHSDKKPEYRLPPMFIGALLLPVGLFWYGWSLQYHTHWIVPIIGSSFIAIGTLYGYLPVQMYLIDSYKVYAASEVHAPLFAPCSQRWFHWGPTLYTTI